MSLLGTACKTFENEEMKSMEVSYKLKGYIGKETFKTESIGKLSNFTFQWTKTLYQNNFKHTVILDPFLHFLRAINVIRYKK